MKYISSTMEKSREDKRMKKKRILLCAVSLIMIIGWMWRYNSLNTYYNAQYQKIRVEYAPGEVVPYGEDTISLDGTMNGYSIRVDKYEVMDLSIFMDRFGNESTNIYTHPDKVVVVYATLFNEKSDAEGIMLTDIGLHGIDNYATMDWELLTISNPVLQGNYGIKLSPNTEYQVVLPYALYQEYFGADTWHRIDEYTWFLHVTASPTEKDIRLE